MSMPVSQEHIDYVVSLYSCFNDNTLGKLWTSSMPYLFPFIVEYRYVFLGRIFHFFSNEDYLPSHTYSFISHTIFRTLEDAKWVKTLGELMHPMRAIIAEWCIEIGDGVMFLLKVLHVHGQFVNFPFLSSSSVLPCFLLFKSSLSFLRWYLMKMDGGQSFQDF